MTFPWLHLVYLVVFFPSILPDKWDEDTGRMIFDYRISPAFSVLKQLLIIEISYRDHDDAASGKLFYEGRRDLR